MFFTLFCALKFLIIKNPKFCHTERSEVSTNLKCVSNFFGFFANAQNDKVRCHCEQGKYLAWQSTEKTNFATKIQINPKICHTGRSEKSTL